MELNNIKSKTISWIKKYRFVILILIVGIAFMLIPGRVDPDQENDNTVKYHTEKSSPTADELLSDILSRIEGAGRVQVLLTLSKGEEIVYQTNSNSTQTDTVITTDADRAQNGLIKQVNPPTYLGAIVVCEGADSPSVRLAIVEAVSNVTGLGTDRISVLKMK